MIIKTTGRRDIDRLFQLSGILQNEKLTHTPFLVFVPTNYDAIKKKERAEHFLTDPKVKEREELAIKEKVMTIKEVESFRKREKQDLKEAEKELKKIEDGIEIKIVNNYKDLLFLSDETPVMVQWRGQWSSDFFHFKIKELKDYLNQNKI